MLMVLMEIVELAWFGMERLCDGKDEPGQELLSLSLN
jgi:hypothetical protein